MKHFASLCSQMQRTDQYEVEHSSETCNTTRCIPKSTCVQHMQTDRTGQHLNPPASLSQGKPMHGRTLAGGDFACLYSQSAQEEEAPDENFSAQADGQCGQSRGVQSAHFFGPRRGPSCSFNGKQKGLERFEANSSCCVASSCKKASPTMLKPKRLFLFWVGEINSGLARKDQNLAKFTFCAAHEEDVFAPFCNGCILLRGLPPHSFALVN